MRTIKSSKFATKVLHIKRVQEISSIYVNLLTIAASKHDYDKLLSIESGDFHKDPIHYEIQRHHWQASRLRDMTLIDLLEMCADGCAVAQVRNGHFQCPLQDDEYGNEALRSLIRNTIHLIDDSLIVDFFRASEYKF